jgi:hypothetical protein
MPEGNNMEGGKRNTWMSHVKRTMKANKGKSLMQVLKMAKKTYKKTGGGAGGVASQAEPLGMMMGGGRRRGGNTDRTGTTTPPPPMPTNDMSPPAKPTGGKSRKSGRKGTKRTRKH